MGRAEWSRARVEDCLTDLERRYEVVPVDQQTVALPAERYAARQVYHEDAVDAYVEIRNGDGEVLHLAEDDADLPGIEASTDESLEREAARAVAERTGVEFRIDGLAGVTIVGISNADDPDAPLRYRLRVVFDASYEGGEPAADTEWQSPTGEPVPTDV